MIFSQADNVTVLEENGISASGNVIFERAEKLINIPNVNTVYIFVNDHVHVDESANADSPSEQSVKASAPIKTDENDTSDSGEIGDLIGFSLLMGLSLWGLKKVFGFGIF